MDFTDALEFPTAKDIASAAGCSAAITATAKRRLAGVGVAIIYANDNDGIWRSDFDAVFARRRERGGAAAELARRARRTQHLRGHKP